MAGHTTSRQSGNIFFALFGAVALVGILGAGVMTFMKGPLATSVKITRINTAETQMALGAQVAVMAAANTPTSGDCDSDGFVEPLEWRDAGASPKPANGGLVPMSIGMTKKDPWGTEYGYCAWDNGTFQDAGCGGAGELRLQGPATGGAYPVVAVVSAGSDKTFTTTCRDFATADVNADGDLLDAGDLPLVSKAVETDDDIIFTYTYDEATGASGGLWSIKSGDPGTAVIGKNIETTGTASLQGGVLLPDSSLITCDATTAGVMARAGSSGIEICDGAGNWTTISGGSGGGVGLTLSNGTATPNASSGMNVYGTCGNATCYSVPVTFTVTNSTASVSDVLAVALSNTTNFEIVSDTCDGNTIAAGANCQVVVRAMATGNGSYAGTLEITGNNSPLATLDGTASNFTGCNAGGVGPGGYYVGCNVAGSYNLIITPSGCTGGMTNPTCAGGADIYKATWATGSGTAYAQVITGCCSSTGLQNTANLLALSGGIYSFPAVDYCAGLVYGGYDDWFLPSNGELVNYFYPNKAVVGAAASVSGNDYWSSTEHNFSSNSEASAMYIGNASLWPIGVSNLRFVRCMRRDPAVTPMPNPTPDTTPVITPTSGFATSYGTVAGATRTSNSITVYGVTGPAPVSVSGLAGAQFSINGGAYGSAASTVTNGQTVTLQVAAPAAGTEGLVTLTIGTATYTWTVRTIQSGNVVRVFTTSTTSSGNLGGLGSADSTCTTRANTAGLSGNWVAVVQASSGVSVESRLPWNWTMLKNMNGALVATSLADFLDGSISAPMNYSESNASISGNIWTGMNSSGVGVTGHCSVWSSNVATPKGWYADSGSTSSGSYLGIGEAGNCNTQQRLLCMETTGGDGTDTDPLSVSGFTGQVVTTPGSGGGKGYSNTVTLSGVSGPVPIQITPSAGAVDILLNGVSVGGATVNAYQNDTLSFVMDAPDAEGTKNTATITLGTDTYDWWVGYANPANERRVFITNSKLSGNFGGISGGDTACQSAASAVGLGAGTWKAMISDTMVSAADRLDFNWGTLKRLDGVVVANGWNDLWDGTIQNPINVSELGATINDDVMTATNTDGTTSATSASGHSCSNWTGSGSGDRVNLGNSGNINSYWMRRSDNVYSACNNRIYCFENSSAGVDTTPAIPNSAGDFEYAIQVPTSTLTTSNAVTVAGLGSGVAATVTITGSDGSPGFKVNGVAGTSGVTTVQNGDSLELTMTSAATASTSHLMTVTVGSGSAVTWRVWTGDSTGTVVKRVFVTSGVYRADSLGGVSGADVKCTSAASAAGLPGSWKAILSGITEAEAAINRVGYNWSILKLVDNTTVVTTTGNLWKVTTVPFTNAILKTESGVSVAGYGAYSNTSVNGLNYSTVSGNYNCSNWNGGGQPHYGTNSVTTSGWVNSGVGSNGCGGSGNLHLYCIEQ